MSQTRLGEKLGVTFQQVQKYERGTNRVAPSRLSVVASVLNLPVTFFFDGMPQSDVTVDEEFAQLTEFVSTREGVELNRAFAQVRSPRSRRDLVQLVRSLAGSDEVDYPL
jgi:transcriptional regulator with XRE-family HTH domain